MAGHDLVVGGSGMLALLCETLAQEGRTVSVVARGRERLARAPAGLIRPLPVDYLSLSEIKSNVPMGNPPRIGVGRTRPTA